MPMTCFRKHHQNHFTPESYLLHHPLALQRNRVESLQNPYGVHCPAIIQAATIPHKFPFNICNFFVVPMGNLLTAHALAPSTTTTTQSLFVPPPLPSLPYNNNNNNKQNKRISMTSGSALVATANTMALPPSSTSSTWLLAFLDCIVKCLRGFAYSSWATAPLANTDNLRGSIVKPIKYLKTLHVEQLEHLDLQSSMPKFTTTTTRLLTVQLQYAENRLLHSSAKLRTSVIMSTSDLTEKNDTLASLDSTNDDGNDNTPLESSSSVAFAIPEPVCVHSRPTFCYFVIDCHSVALETRKNRVAKCAQKTTRESEENILQCISYTQQSRRIFHSCDEVDDDDDDDEDEEEDTEEDDEDNDNDRNNNCWHNTSMSSSEGRQRYLSECSDDFICFAEDNENEDENDVHPNRQLLLEWQADNEEEENDENDDDDEEEEYAEENESLNYIKKVRFNLKPKVHIMRTWDYAYRSARKGNWEDYARDRTRFKRRIETTAVYLDPILSSEHRSKIYENRFADKKFM